MCVRCCASVSHEIYICLLPIHNPSSRYLSRICDTLLPLFFSPLYALFHNVSTETVNDNILPAKMKFTLYTDI